MKSNFEIGGLSSANPAEKEYPKIGRSQMSELFGDLDDQFEKAQDIPF